MALAHGDLRSLPARLRSAALGWRAARRKTSVAAWRAGIGRRPPILSLRAAGDRRRGGAGSPSAPGPAAAKSPRPVSRDRAGRYPADVRSALSADEPAALIPQDPGRALSAGAARSSAGRKETGRTGLGRLVASSRRSPPIAAERSVGAAVGGAGRRVVQPADGQPATTRSDRLDSGHR